jgi:uncharacterized protein YbjT (DUF2867 family)
MTLVVGATGLLGTEICRRLFTAGKSVRAMVRKTSDPAKKEMLKALGAELVEADLKDHSTIDQACQGATTVITTPTAIGARQEGDTFRTVDLEGQMHLVDAARIANVGQFVFISVSGSLGKADRNPLVDAKRAVEEHLRQSRLTYTIVRPSFFMEIWLSSHLGFDFNNAKATIYGSGKNKISYISLFDVAQFVAKALSNPAGRNAVIELGGAEPLSQIEVVRIFEEISGGAFAMQFVPEEALRARREAATNPVEQTFASLTLAAAHGDPIDMENTLRKFSLRPKSVRDYAKLVLKPGLGQ